jgi:hypothetical protein
LSQIDVVESATNRSFNSDKKLSDTEKMTSVQITTYEHYMKLLENVGVKVRYEMDEKRRENGELLVKLVAVNAANN